MQYEKILSELKKINSIAPTGDNRGDVFRMKTRLQLLIKAMEDGRQSVESVREDSSKVFRLD